MRIVAGLDHVGEHTLAIALSAHGRQRAQLDVTVVDEQECVPFGWYKQLTKSTHARSGLQIRSRAASATVSFHQTPRWMNMTAVSIQRRKPFFQFAHFFQYQPISNKIMMVEKWFPTP